MGNIRVAWAGGAVALLAAAAVQAQIFVPVKPIKPILFDPERLVAITAGAYHTCVTKANNNVYCWGLNHLGQIGTSTNDLCNQLKCVVVPRFVLNAFITEAGYDHTCAVASNGQASCWGGGNAGQLGMGVLITSQATPWPVSGGLVFTSISAGDYSTCGNTTTGMFCWGQMGVAPSAQQPSPPATLSPFPRQIMSYNGYQRVSIDRNSACAIADVTDTWKQADCWGNNSDGQLGISNGSQPVVPTMTSSFGTAVARISLHNHVTCADLLNGKVQCAGLNGEGQLGRGSFSMNSPVAVDVGGGMALAGVSAGGAHACALDPAGRAWCWGRNLDGQTGNGTAGAAQANPQAVAGGRSYRAIAAGRFHTCAIGTDNKIWCWGNNAYGQVGPNQPGNPVSILAPVQLPDPV